MTAGQDALVSETREAALRWQGLGVSVIPVRADKRPTIGSWKKYQETAATSSQVKAWMNGSTEGVGVVLGDVSRGLAAIDFDNLKFYEALMEQLDVNDPIAKLVDRIRKGYSESSPKGAHWLVYIEGGPGRSMKLANDVDKAVLAEFRGADSYIIVTPSNFGEDRAYQQIEGGPESIVTITAEEKDELCEWLRSFNRYVPASRMVANTTWELPRLSGDGSRPGDEFNRRGTWAEVLGPKGWTVVTSDGDLTTWRRPHKPYGHSATTGVRAEGGHDILYNFTTSTDLDAERGYTLFTAFAVLHHGGDFTAAAKDLVQKGYGTASVVMNDIGNSQVLLDLHGADLRRVQANNPYWLHWNGCYWSQAAKEEMWGLARDVSPQIKKEALLLNNDPGMQKWALQAGNAPRMRAMLEVLESEEGLRFSEEELDSNNWLLNCRNGTVDLVSGEIMPFKRTDFLTHQIPVEFDPNAHSTRLDEFLRHLARDCDDCLEQLQRIAGYCITGDTAAQKLFVLVGPTASGKSTLIRLLKRLLGPQLSVSLNPNSLLSKGNSAISNDLAMMRGKRLVVIGEIPAGFQPDESVIKTLSGQDDLQARKLFSEFEVANRTAKLLLFGNDYPFSMK